jgi:hypothetical protein
MTPTEFGVAFDLSLNVCRICCICLKQSGSFIGMHSKVFFAGLSPVASVLTRYPREFQT